MLKENLFFGVTVKIALAGRKILLRMVSGIGIFFSALFCAFLSRVDVLI